MAKFQNQGAFFLGTLVSSEQKFLKVLIQNALKAGYTKFVEPCAGAFAMSHLAIQTGFKPSQIDASDVSMFTAIMGYAITDRPLSELCLQAKGFSDKELLNPAVALYAWKYLSVASHAGKDYYYNYLVDLKQRREEHIKALQQQIERAKSVLGGMKYRNLDMMKHIEEVIEDPHALVIVNPPTYLAGFEKYYDTQGNMTWKAPSYSIFDPITGLSALIDKVKDAKCLVVCYEERPPSDAVGEPVFARYGVRKNMNVYLVSNRPDEAESMAEGKKISRPQEQELSPLKCPMLPIDSELSETSQVQICRIETKAAQYYRKLWTHNFTGSPAQMNFAVLIDDKVAGVFGIMKAGLTIGDYGNKVSDAVFLMYGMTVPHRNYRLNRLLTMLAQNRDFVRSICTDWEFEKVRHIRTVQMTKYPEAKEMRGIMKLERRDLDSKFGYKLFYKSELKDRTESQTLIEWLRREKKWQLERAKALTVQR